MNVLIRCFLAPFIFGISIAFSGENNEKEIAYCEGANKSASYGGINKEIYIENIEFFEANYRHPRFFEEEEKTLWIEYGPSLLKSNDLMETMKKVWETPDEVGTIDLILVSGDNVIVGADGVVFVGNKFDENMVLEEKFSLSEGQFSHKYGYHVYNDIVLIGSYGGNSNTDVQPNEVWLSKDGGDSFELVLEATEYVQDKDLHIHDVQYDPFRERIWVAAGDSGNTQIYFSDDYGRSWETLNKEPPKANYLRVTAIVAFEHGVVFGSDTLPTGLYYWGDWSESSQSPEKYGFVNNRFFPLYEEESEGRMGLVSHGLSDYSREIFVLPVDGEVGRQGAAHLLMSYDGCEWFEVWRESPDKDKDYGAAFGPMNVLGIFEDDGEKKIIMSYPREYPGGGYAIATLPSLQQGKR